MHFTFIFFMGIYLHGNHGIFTSMWSDLAQLNGSKMPARDMLKNPTNIINICRVSSWMLSSFLVLILFSHWVISYIGTSTTTTTVAVRYSWWTSYQEPINVFYYFSKFFYNSITLFKYNIYVIWDEYSEHNTINQILKKYIY